MRVTVLTDKKQVGKTANGTNHPISGTITQKQFDTYGEFANIIRNLNMHQCFTVGLFPDGYTYVPANDVNSLSKPKHIARGASNAYPGHILCIDCDFDTFGHLKGKGLHEFLSKYLPDIFEGAGYVTTNSTSHYTKGSKGFHQYYLFKNPSDFTQLIYLIERLFQHHNLITYKLASNYSRAFIRTPIDTKLRELQQPIFEASPQRLQALGIDKSPEIIVEEGNVINMSALALPTIDTSNAVHNYNKVMEQAQQELDIKAGEYLKEHGSSLPATFLERGYLSADMVLHKYVGGKSMYEETTLTSEIMGAMREHPPHELYMAVGEPEYASHQTAKLFYEHPLDLNTYRLSDQAHGGTVYRFVFSYDDLDLLLKEAIECKISKKDAIKLINATNNLTVNEASLIGTEYGGKKLLGITPAVVKKSIWQNNVNNVLETHQPLDVIGEDDELLPEDVHTAMAALQQARVDMPEVQEQARQQGAFDERDYFVPPHINIIKDSTYAIGNSQILTKPGPKHSYIDAADPAKVAKDLSALYPPTNISPHADNVVTRALIEKMMPKQRITKIQLKASLHTEKLYFGDDGVVDITTRQPRPSFANVPTTVKAVLDQMSGVQESEFRDIYINQSLGHIWDLIAEMVYIKKVYPQLKSDFIWLNAPSDAGKNFNLEVAAIIATYEKTNLDQFFEQASKLSARAVVSASFLFHDEVKAFKHSWNELGTYHTLREMYASTGIITQLPLKVLASKENVLTEGTQQQKNRLLFLRSNAKPWKEIEDIIGVNATMDMTAIAYKTIYEKFTDAYNKYAQLPEQKALQLAITTAKQLAKLYAPEDMVITEDYIKDLIETYWLQELFDTEDGLVYIPEHLKRYVKWADYDKGHLIINYKSTAKLGVVADYILSQTSSKLDTKALQWELRGMDWETLGVKKYKQQTILGHSAYGYIHYIKVPEEMIPKGE